MVGGVRLNGVTALLIVIAVVLAAAAMPMLVDHSPLETAGPDSAPAIDGSDVDAEEFDEADSPQDLDSIDDSAAGDGVIHEDFATLADDDEIAETMTGLAGVLAVLFGGDHVDGAVGEPPEQGDPNDQTTDSEREDHQRDEETETDGEGDDDADTTAENGEGDDEEASEDEQGDDQEAGENGEGDDEEAGENGEGDEQEAGEDEHDDDFSGAESDATEPSDDSSTDEEATGGESDGAGEESESLTDRVDPMTIGLLIGGLVAIGVGWFAYRTGRGILSIVLSIPTLLLGAVTRFVFGLTAVIERINRAVRAASSVFALPRLFVIGVVQFGRELAATLRSVFDRGQPTVAAVDAEDLSTEREQIRAAWRAVVDAVGGHQYNRRTAGEIRQRALDSGLPEPPVSTLVTLFRDVEYGAKDPTNRADHAVSAANELSGLTDPDDSASEPTSTSDTPTDAAEESP